MDKGAHFHRCDFQVHTPRDARWSGGDAVTDEERKIYSEELIRACRDKELDAIAITDHHDFAFFPFIKKAAQNELDDTGNPIPEDSRILVFPGLELTLTAPNCQALLLLDANFPENLFQSVLTTLAITPAPTTDSKHANVQRIPQTVISDLENLYHKLNSLDHVKGRFIVLPNVSETGNGTILRSGFANFYKKMPCVGAYVDGSITQFGTGNASIVSGKNREYGFKAVGLFQTSDNRSRNHCDLGKHTSWVKWSEPTAEALRQACLAKESRLSQDEPQLPNIWITSLSVSNSKFLGRLDLDFNQQYNAIIGGRGTGKSTILEYLRWGLCDQPVESDELDAVQNKRKTLINNTLQSFDGEVHVTFYLNDIKHIVKRNSKRQDILLKIGDAEFVPATEQQVRNLLPIQAYSQKQLSSVGIRLEELKRFVELPIKQGLDQVRSEIRDTEARIRVAYGNLIRKAEIEIEVKRNEVEIESLSKQLISLRKNLKGLSEDDQRIIEQKAKYDSEETLIERLQNEISNAKDQINNLRDVFTKRTSNNLQTGEYLNEELIKSIEALVDAKFVEITQSISNLVKLLDQGAMNQIENEIKKWVIIREAFDKKYEEAKAKAKVNQQQLDQIREIEKRIMSFKKVQIEKQNALSSLGSPDAEYTKLRTKWDDLHKQKINALGKQCGQFNVLSNGLIKAEVAGSLDINRLAQRIKSGFSGMNIREDKIDKICQRVVKATDAITEWNGVLAELEKLALHTMQSPDPLPDTSILNACGFIESEKKRIATNFDSTKWIELSLAELEFNPIFSYCTNKEKSEFIGFADASAGQQATALLTVLLNQQGAPLIIDQPEDDIDSKMSPEIVHQIWEAKSKRQLIFSSHNANFVVNGDAELVACCDYVKTGDQTNGHIKIAGAIDNESIKEEITLVTEGGRQAFKLRMEKYGF